MAYGGRSQVKMSEETFDFICTACAKKDKTVKAVKYCIECSGYCCQSCTDVHVMFPALENHNLMEVNQGNQASDDQSSVEFPTERCSIHKGKVLDMYCEGHNAVGCYICIAKDHKSCPDSHIHSIPDMIDTLFKPSDCKQTHSLLKDMMVSMTTVSKSKDIQLEKLNKSKNEALGKVDTFEKALEAILRKKAESSRQEIKDVYKKLEADIVGKQQTVDTIHEDLKTTDDKLQKSEGNRAQRFVCSKLTDLQIHEAEKEKTKQEGGDKADVQIAFTPDPSLTGHLNALRGIGQVLHHGRLKQDLYKVKGSKDIPIKLSDDSSTCSSFGSCLTPDNQLLVTDCSNKKLKRINIQNMSVVEYCTLYSKPYGVCCVSKHEVAVACQSNNKIQFVSIQDKMSPTRQIKMAHACYGVAFKEDKLYVTDGYVSLFVYDMTGNLLKTLLCDNSRNKLFDCIRHVTACEDGVFVADKKNGRICFDKTDKYLSTITDTEIKGAIAVCEDGRGNEFVVGHNSQNVVQFNQYGEKIGVVVKQGDGLQSPLTACFHQGLNRLFVTMYNSDVVKMYELE